MFASQQSGRIWGIDQRNGRARRNPEFWLERSFTERANNEDWLENNFDKTVHPMENERGDHPTLAEEEERILRCLGAAVIMQWNTLPTKLQKELFDNASSIGDLLQTDALKGQIARFLHKHKDDGTGPSSDASRKGGR